MTLPSSLIFTSECARDSRTKSGARSGMPVSGSSMLGGRSPIRNWTMHALFGTSSKSFGKFLDSQRELLHS
ncbi:hypothetical protein C1H46_036374 [Malus baccata]|uniref:Uncharacterized protein n=1 Tax=Malus baccata TaxID=106549 RepID=A0A540KV11_MALBA|nr:hypothetical protein C1H46_036374 [Malus baccata]